MRPQKHIENTDKISDETYQIKKPDDKKSDERDQLGKINKIFF